MLITDAKLADGRIVDVSVEDGTIVEVARGLDPDREERHLDAGGKLLLPGAIDAHVHVREPGFTHKEDWASGSRSAAAGGVTTVVDQPNTDPPTIDGESFDLKAELAGDSYVDYGINGGVTPAWDPESLFDRPLFALGEVFLADSTGDMGIDSELFADAIDRAAAHGVPVTVHAEDATLFDERQRDRDAGGIGRDANVDIWSAYRTAEAEIAAIERAVEVGADSGASIHIAHTSTPEGIDAAADGGATCEVCPHHLFLSRDDLEGLGTFGRMNPPVRSEARRREVFDRVADGTVDIVATDHAPHTIEEKQRGLWDAPSGVPGVETMLPLLLAAAADGAFSYERVRDLVARTPAELFGLDRKGRIEPGRDADLVIVDPDERHEIAGDRLHSKCGWTPYEGKAGVFPEVTIVRGTLAYERVPGSPPGKDETAERFGEPTGRNVRSNESP